MEHCYSDKVGQDVYGANDLLNGIEARVHKDQPRENEGIARAQKDWNDSVQPIKSYFGNLGKPYHFIQLCIPECLPERLEIIAYANEISFLYDDHVEILDIKPSTEDVAKLLEPFALYQQQPDSNGLPETRLLSKLSADMMAIDHTRAITTMKAWAKFVRASIRIREPFKSLEEYIPARAIDAGETMWYGFVTYGMALTIPDHELDLCTRLAKPVYASLALVNDLYSWEKEKAEARTTNKPFIFNAIWVIVNERSTTEDEAKVICKEEIKKQIAQYCRNVEEAQQDPFLSKDLKTYLEALLYSHAGNLVWSTSCPRYHEF